MSVITIADDTNAYNGRSGEVMPLGGTESSVIHLAEALAGIGHEVNVLTKTDQSLTHKGVNWASLENAREFAGPDLYLPVQHPRLFGLVPGPRCLAVWLIWPVNNLRHYKQIPAMWRFRPIPVVASQWQAREYSWILPHRNRPIVIPLAVEDDWRGFDTLDSPPPPIAVYASMPQRGLPWLLPVWEKLILPRVPEAQLQVLGLKTFAQPFTDAIPELPLAANLGKAARASLRVHPGLPRDAQRAVVRSSRVYLYGGHRSEAFCLAAAEAQALGVPAVVGKQTVLPERVQDGRTGFHCDTPEAFADAAVRLLTDDALWAGQHAASIAEQQGPSWSDVARMFETALL